MVPISKTFLIRGGIALLAVLLLGWTLKGVFSREPKAQVIQPAYTPQMPSGASAPDMSQLAKLAGMSDAQALMLKYATGVRAGQNDLSPQAMEYLKGTKLEILGETNTSVHYLQTFPDGVTSEETITIIPNQKYTPTSAEVEKSTQARAQVFRPSLAIKQISSRERVFTLQYYLSEAALPPQILQRIGQSKSAAQSSQREFFTIVPKAWAQEGGDNGGQFVTWNVMELVKSMDVKLLEGMEWEKSAKFVDNILTMRDVVNGYNEISNWLGEIAELKECAEHPTNPLTQKASGSSEYQNNVIGSLDNSSWEIQGTAFPKVANIAAGAVTQKLPFGTGVLISPIVSANDQAIEQFAEEEIANAKKMVVPCDSPMMPGNLRPMHLTLQYSYNNTEMGIQEKQTASGELDLDSKMGGLEGEEPGKFKVERKQVQAGPNVCANGYKGKGEGDANIKAEAGGTPYGGVVELRLSVDLNLHESGKVPDGDHCSEQAHDGMRNYNFGCRFDHLDLVHGGTFSHFQDGDGHGTCTIELTRK
ncbi:MAG TPA: hypothetical protein VFA85_10065 [Terriglobales bacterium]|nr:hypothetical protein [Terriglobales bacterium]